MIFPQLKVALAKKFRLSRDKNWRKKCEGIILFYFCVYIYTYAYVRQILLSKLGAYIPTYPCDFYCTFCWPFREWMPLMPGGSMPFGGLGILADGTLGRWIAKVNITKGWCFHWQTTGIRTLIPTKKCLRRICNFLPLIDSFFVELSIGLPGWSFFDPNDRGPVSRISSQELPVKTRITNYYRWWKKSCTTWHV